MTLRVLEAALGGRGRTAPASSVLEQALALDAARRNGKGKAIPQSKHPDYHTRVVEIARRQRTAAYLATFDLHTPHPGIAKKGVAPLLVNGYLKRKGDGYVRTGKEFQP